MLALRWTLALLLALLGGLAVLRAPHRWLWEPAVAATTLGAFLFPVAALITWTGAPDLPSALALVGGVLLATPWLRATRYAPSVRRRVVEVFGDRPWTGPRPPRAEPLSLGQALLVGARGPAPEHHQTHPELGLELFLYRATGSGPHPVVVAIHGGSWSGGEPDQLTAMYRYLAARGVAVAAISYRLAPQHPFPAQLDDVTHALHWLREHAEDLDLDPDRTVLYGRSAGGHLALLAAYRQVAPGLRGVVALYPPTDLNWSWEHPTNPWVLDSFGTLSDFLGGARDEVPAAYDAASPIRFVDADSPPTLLFHGTRDELVFAEQSRHLARELSGHGVPHVLVEAPWDTHGFDINLGGPGGQLLVWSVERFLGRVLATNVTSGDWREGASND